jgi:hypothetical protein
MEAGTVGAVQQLAARLTKDDLFDWLSEQVTDYTDTELEEMSKDGLIKIYEMMVRADPIGAIDALFTKEVLKVREVSASSADNHVPLT